MPHQGTFNNKIDEDSFTAALVIFKSNLELCRDIAGCNDTELEEFASYLRQNCRGLT